jgi:glycosyltransferase involved in cell wall biosynthesis
LQLVHKPQRRGAEVFALQLSGELRRQGQEARIAYLYPHEGEERLPWGETDLVLGEKEDHRLERLTGFQPRLLWRLRSVIQEWQPEIVQANGGRTVKYGALAARLSGNRTWALVYRNIGEPAQWVRGWWRQFFYRRLVIPSVDGVVGVSEATLAQIQTFYRLRVPAVHIPNGADPAALVPARSRAEVRHGAETPQGVPVLLFAGCLSAEKRVDRLLRVFSQVLNGVPQVHLWVMGDGPLHRDLAQQADGLGVAEQARFLGALTDVASHMKAADLLVLSSDTEGIPAVVLEAGLLGLPVVSTRVGGLPECVIDGETGLLVEPEDEAGLARAIVDLLRDPEQRQAMGQRAEGWIHSRFTMERITGQYLDFYREVLDVQRAAA